MRASAPLAAVLLLMAGCQRYSPVPDPPAGPSTSDTAVPAETAKAPTAVETISLSAQARQIPVIMYHDAVRDGKRTVWYDVTESEFRNQLEEIERRGLKPITLQAFYDHLTGKAVAPENAIVLTFDDNYQGFYDVAYPLLKARNWPSSMFVHTGFVGQTTGAHPKMSYDTLRTLVKEGLVEIGSHTISHPNDLSDLDPLKQEEELRKSKDDLEKNLGIKVVDFAYPNGGNDAACQERAKVAGYRMAFTIVNGLAESSPGIMAINRYVHTKLDKALEDRDRAIAGGAGRIADLDLDRKAPVNYREGVFAGVKLSIVEGGDPFTLTSPKRETVKEFIERTPGAVAGINGTFFALAAIRETDNRLVGPCLTTGSTAVLPDPETFRYEKLKNRPIIVMSPDKFAVVPYNPWTMSSDAVFRAFRPDVTDVFMGGAWLVRGGVPATESELRTFGSKDLMDFRRRALFGIDGQGRIFLACAKQSCSSEKFAAAAAEAGVREAVLLDSGFSTSLVYDGKILASGHSTKDNPSRPVPHAILLKGALDPEGQKVAKVAEPATTLTGGDPAPRRRRSRRR